MTDMERAERLTKAFAVMLNAFPKAKGETADSWDILINTYEIAVDGVPVELVEKVALGYTQATIERGDHRFRPAPAEFAAACRHRHYKAVQHQQFLDRQFKSLPAPDLPPEQDRQEHVLRTLGRLPERGKTVEVEPLGRVTPQMRQEEAAERQRLVDLGAGDYATGCYREMAGCTLEEAQEWRRSS